jgi:magnesium transporter
MIIAYVPAEKHGVNKVEIGVSGTIPKGAIWIDLFDPSLEEEKMVEKAFKIDAPTREEMDKFEVISPFYKDGESYYMTITTMNKLENRNVDGSAVVFILHPKCLITLRYSKFKAFTYFSSRMLRSTETNTTPELVLEGLVESVVHSLADVLERTGNEIDKLLIEVFDQPSEMRHQVKKGRRGQNASPQSTEEQDRSGMYYTNVIKNVGRTGNLVSKIRESLVSIHRMLIFFGQIDDDRFLAKKEYRTRFRNLTREMHSLTEYANFLSQRNSFLLDATLGMINVQQNMIIKVFTVAAAVFLPPTLIASIYGMNFKDMPELSWSFGYPMALFLILCSAIVPYAFFKRKGWL